MTTDTAQAVARLVTRLDGMPLAIELAAARVETLGVTGLLDRLDDRFALLAGGNRLASSRHRSLAATVEWSYQLLEETEQRVFRQVSLFPGPFTLAGAEALAGPDAGPAVLHLVDCSLLVPPRPGPDGRPRYGMLETLRAYGTRLLVQAGEDVVAGAALARYALAVAEQAGAGLATNTTEEVAAARWLDAEDAMMRQVLGWAAEHDPAVALQLAVALASWWLLRGRAASGYPVMREASERAVPGEPAWCDAQQWLGRLTLMSGDLATSLGHFTAVCDAAADRGPSRALALSLGGRSVTLANLGQVAEALGEARRSLAMAGERGSPVLIFALMGAGDLAAAESACAAAVARCRDAGDVNTLPSLLMVMADLDVQGRRSQDAAVHLREGLQAALRAGTWWDVLNGLWYCASLCTATGRDADGVALWEAYTVQARRHGLSDDTPGDVRRREEALEGARQALGPVRFRAAQERGAAMSMDTAAEYALMLSIPAPAPPTAATGPGLGGLSARERELVTLVAQGHTDAQIAAQLYISVRTVGSHLDRIRDKTGCRRRADLTRLALSAGLI